VVFASGAETMGFCPTTFVSLTCGFTHVKRFSINCNFYNVLLFNGNKISLTFYSFYSHRLVNYYLIKVKFGINKGSIRQMILWRSEFHTNHKCLRYLILEAWCYWNFFRQISLFNCWANLGLMLFPRGARTYLG
jgi:hypothetical protein